MAGGSWDLHAESDAPGTCRVAFLYARTPGSPRGENRKKETSRK